MFPIAIPAMAVKALSAIRSIALITIPVPLLVIALAFAWFHFDKSSAIRKAVDAKAVSFVAGAEIAAADARAEANEAIALVWKDKAISAQLKLKEEAQARIEFEAALAESEQRAIALQGDLNELLNSDKATSLPLHPDLFRRLHNN